MTSVAEYYHLSTVTMHACTMERNVYGPTGPNWRCIKCGLARRVSDGVDVQIQERPSRIDKPLSFVSGVGIGIVWIPFLKAFCAETVGRDLILGKITGSTGIVIKDWVTFQGRHRVIVRGSTNAQYRQCETCLQWIYFAMGNRYLFPAPPKDADLMESDCHGLLVRKGALPDLEFGKWKNLWVDKLQVVDSPSDLLGDFERLI